METATRDQSMVRNEPTDMTFGLDAALWAEGTSTTLVLNVQPTPGIHHIIFRYFVQKYKNNVGKFLVVYASVMSSCIPSSGRLRTSITQQIWSSSFPLLFLYSA